MNSKLVCVVFLLFVVFSLSSFSENSKVKIPKIDFESEPDGNLIIENKTGADLVLFAGRPEFDVILGGVSKKSSRSINLSNIKMPKQGCFLLRAATLDTFVEEKGQLKESDYNDLLNIIDGDFIYSALVVFSENEKCKISIPQFVDVKRDYCFYITNLSSSFVLEIRTALPNHDGELFASIAPMERHKKIYVVPGKKSYGYDLFPVFVYVNPDTAEKTEFLPKRADVEYARPDYDTGRIDLCEFSDSGLKYDSADFKKPMRLFFE